MFHTVIWYVRYSEYVLQLNITVKQYSFAVAWAVPDHTYNQGCFIRPFGTFITAKYVLQ